MALTSEDLSVLEASMLNCNVFTKYYFDVTLMPHQIAMAHANQTTLLTLGGRGSGKTFGYMMDCIWMATLMPDTHILWTSYTAGQASIAFYDVAMPFISQSEEFQKFLPEGMGSLKKKPYPSIHIQIPGTGLPESVIHFMPSDSSGAGNTKRGYTWDRIHIDEGGLIDDEKVINSLRPSMRGNRKVPGNPPRICRLSISTTPTAVEWLRKYWDKANNPEHPEYDPYGYAAIRVSSQMNTTLVPSQIEAFFQDMTEEEKSVEGDAEFPQYLGNEFSVTVVDQCEDITLMQEVNDAIASGAPGYETRDSKYGTVMYQKPAIDGHHYMLVGDPGTGNPPYRNAGVILCWDVTERPYELVYFDWVFGAGDYRPFFSKYEWALGYYKPISASFDATGTQKAMDQLYFEQKGLAVEGISVTTEKFAMINALKILMQKSFLRFPMIRGLRMQLLNYSIDKDKKIAQDIVMAMAMSSHQMRRLFYLSDDSDTVENPVPYDSSDHERYSTRDTHRTYGRR